MNQKNDRPEELTHYLQMTITCIKEKYIRFSDLHCNKTTITICLLIPICNVHYYTVEFVRSENKGSLVCHHFNSKVTQNVTYRMNTLHSSKPLSMVQQLVKRVIR